MKRTVLKARNREALIDACLAEVAARGYRDARLEDIADRAELSTGAIYSIFGSKRNLLAASMDQLAEELAAELDALADPELPVADVLRGAAGVWMRMAASKGARDRFAFELEATAAALREPEAGEPIPVRRLRELLTGRRLGRGRTTGEQARRLSLAAHALLSGLAQRALLDPASVSTTEAEDAAAALAHLVG
ncbi:TetR/AcrR family transcriptional regulator [Amycolatopsis sp. 195334CR]|uniref:TetR/AcrR family transcriptional regulator n=1 Tax=Amycolatopsis sp. 195334CR TaxID=2814588 RepID=UPI001A8CCB13|nr:TetR/AcrR family transcriptional regulator [Amycolatopsis sp. 195334CR]MBN6037989.1 TetR family transcriptional regulator [Amycolatopsis sp. 195334CR]